MGQSIPGTPIGGPDCGPPWAPPRCTKVGLRAIVPVKTVCRREGGLPLRRLYGAVPCTLPGRAGPIRARGSGDSGPSDRSGTGKGLSIGDRLLDYIEGGPKLRRWYGAGEQMSRDGTVPDKGDKRGTEGGGKEEEKEEEVEEEEEGGEEGGGIVLVTDAGSETGQMVVLSLILKRRRIRVLVKDAEEATEGFGPYVRPISGSVQDEKAVEKALKGAACVVITGRAGLVPERAAARGNKVKHLVLLSSIENNSGLFGSLLGSTGGKADEATLAACGVPHTVVRTGRLQEQPSGQGVVIGRQGEGLKGTLSREDAAAVCLAAIECGPPSTARILEAVNAPNGHTSDAEFVGAIAKIPELEFQQL